jgi:hypothetical protein
VSVDNVNIMDEGKGKDKVVPVLNKAPRHENVLGEWRYSILDLITRWN